MPEKKITAVSPQLIKPGFSLINRVIFCLAICVIASLPVTVNGQSYVEVFGQNRIQDRKFDWKYFDTKHFRVYHYDRAGRQLGRYVAEESEGNIGLIEKKLGGTFPKRFNIILYNSYDDYRQSNIGLKEESQLTENTKAGSLNLVGDKLVVYFTGQHTDLRHQVRTGMARVVMERMMFGDNFKKMVKNALLLNLPEWVTDGYISYLVDGWDAKSNSEWKSLLDAQPNTGFFELAEDYPELAGKAFWKFVADQYGTNTVKNLLYSMQMKTGLNKAMKEHENLGLKVTKAYDSCIKFYKHAYALDAKKQEKPNSTKGMVSLKVPKDNTVIRNIRISPRGNDISYVAWRYGQFTVYSQKTAGDQEVNTLLEGGQKDLTEESDPNYPILAWSGTGLKMAILYKKGSQTRLKVYSSLRGRIDDYIIPKNRFDRVLGMTFTQDDDKLIFSAIRKSQTDLYMFTFKGSKMTNITDDAWDDVEPVFVSGGSRTGILFLSNRPKPNMNVPVGVNELPNGPMNVFFYNTKTGVNELLQCTNVTKGRVTQPIQYGLENFAYLYDSNGINNKYVVLFARNRKNNDSAYSVPITNYTTSILCQQYMLASGEVGDVVQDKDKYNVCFHELVMPSDSTVKKLSPTILSVEKPEDKSSSINVIGEHGWNRRNEEEPAVPEIKGGNAFQSEFTDTTVAPAGRKERTRGNKTQNAGTENAADSSVLSEITDSAYVKMAPSQYRLSFKPDFLSVKLDNSTLFSQYQSIGSNGGHYSNPPLGGLATLSLNELMENHRITAGLQLPLDLKEPHTTYFLQYQNFVRRLDWGLLFLRSADKKIIEVGYVDNTGTVVFTQDQVFKSSVSMVQSDFGYPLDRLRSFRFHSALRQDKFMEKVTDTLSLAYSVPSSNTYTSLSRLEYVFDNTLSPTLNIRFGTRYKFYTEYLYTLNKGNKSCYNFGLDMRNYQRLYRNTIVANRLAYAHSDGTSQVDFLMGGVDNWYKPKEAPNTGQPASNYGFQALATPLRGYKQSALTGNNYVLFNTEFRVPLTTFIRRPIQSAMLKNLQFVAFVDAGYAWTRFLPDSSAAKSTYTYPKQPPPPGPNNVSLTIHVPNSGVGYGAGLRTLIFGYFVRLDVASNVDLPKWPIVYLALGTDF